MPDARNDATSREKGARDRASERYFLSPLACPREQLRARTAESKGDRTAFVSSGECVARHAPSTSTDTAGLRRRRASLPPRLPLLSSTLRLSMTLPPAKRSDRLCLRALVYLRATSRPLGNLARLVSSRLVLPNRAPFPPRCPFSLVRRPSRSLPPSPSAFHLAPPRSLCASLSGNCGSPTEGLTCRSVRSG